MTPVRLRGARIQRQMSLGTVLRSLAAIKMRAWTGCHGKTPPLCQATMIWQGSGVGSCLQLAGCGGNGRGGGRSDDQRGRCNRLARSRQPVATVKARAPALWRFVGPKQGLESIPGGEKYAKSPKLPASCPPRGAIWAPQHS